MFGQPLVVTLCDFVQFYLPQNGGATFPSESAISQNNFDTIEAV